MSNGSLAKRIFDVTVSVGLLATSAPIVILALTVIRLESRGSPLFAQRRVGRDGKTFTLFKLRTMTTGTGDFASHEVSPHQITPLGHMLRRYKIDELPQLWNVLNGTMSLVGPRPCLPSQSELIEARSARGLLAFPPGITGPAQIAGIDMSDPIRLADVEARYYPNNTLVDDFRILLKTFTGSGRGDAANTLRK